MASAKLARILGKDASSINASSPLSEGRPAVDAVFLSQLVSPAVPDKLGFLFGVYTKSLQGGGEYGDYLKKQSVSYAALFIMNPRQFSGASAPSTAQTFLDLMKADGSSPLTFPSGFFPALIAELRSMSLTGYASGTCLQSLLVGHRESVVPLLIKEVIKLNLVDPFHGHFAVLQELGSSKGAMEAVLKSMFWETPLPMERLQGAGVATEKATLLGVFLRLSSIPETSRDPTTRDVIMMRHPVGEACFADMHRKSRQEVDIAIDSVRVQLHAVQDCLTIFVRGMLKDPTHQDKMFSWVASALRFSEARKKEGFGRYFSSPTSSVGFLFNLFTVMLRLCKPFLDPDDKKSLKIDGSWLVSDHRVDLRKETRVVSTENEVASWMDVRNQARIQQFQQVTATAGGGKRKADESEKVVASESFGTISELFFLTLRAQQVLAPAKVAKEMQKLSEQLYHANRALDTLEQGSEEREKAEEEVAGLMESRIGYDVVLFDPVMLEDMLALARLTARWLFRVAEAPPSIMPLPPPSALFKSLPEFCIENVVDTLTLVAQNIPSVLETLPVTTLHDFLNFVMAFSSSKAHVKNPYLRGKLLQVACFMIPGDRRQGFEFGGGNLSGLFQEHEVSRHHLVPSLINFYIDVEVTGGHNQFYDKFIYRNHMAKILLYVCQFPAYLESVEKFSKDPNTRDTFIRFVTMMLNDANYCFQEAMLKLTEIRKAQHEMALPEYAARPVEERTALEETLSQDGNHTKWGLQQLKDVLNMMQMLTGHVGAPFVGRELGDQTAEMLLYLIDKIAGPKCIELKVTDPEKFAFKPKELLSLTSDIFLKLAAHKEFGAVVIRDGRSYKPEVLKKVVHLNRSFGLQDEAWLNKFDKFRKELEALEAGQTEADQQLGEIPDDFQDPISADIMRDPVRLPTSGQFCDRKTIERILLSDETDPFNRMRLTVDMLEPAEELKAKIEAWITSRRNGAPQAAP